MSDRVVTMTERLAGAILARDGIVSHDDERFAAAYPAAVTMARELAEWAELETECPPTASYDPPVMQGYPRFCWNAFSDGKRWGWAQAIAERDDVEQQREDALIAALIDATNALAAVSGTVHNPRVGITYNTGQLVERLELQLDTYRTLRDQRRERIANRGPRGI